MSITSNAVRVVSTAPARSVGSFNVKQSVISSGGGMSAGGGYVATGSAGQSGAGATGLPDAPIRSFERGTFAHPAEPLTLRSMP